MQMGINPLSGVVDLVIAPSGTGRGRIAIDRTPVSSLLIAIGTDRRADPDDITPDMQTALSSQEPGLFSRRGWVGDILLPSGQRLGSRAWLYERGRQNEETRSGVADALAEAVAPIADYHGIKIDTDARWGNAKGILIGRVSTLGHTVTTQAQIL